MFVSEVSLHWDVRAHHDLSNQLNYHCSQWVELKPKVHSAPPSPAVYKNP